MFGLILLLLCPWCASGDEPLVAVEKPGAEELIQRLLAQWEAASATQPERSMSSRQSLTMKVTKDLNSHAALAYEQLTGAVRAEELRQQFAWSVVEESPGQICLEARPTDETEKLFYDSIRIWLDTKSLRLVKLETIDRQRTARARLNVEWPRVEPIIVQAAFVTAAVPADEEKPRPPELRREFDKRLRLFQESAPTDLSHVEPQLAEILEKWERVSSEAKTVKVRFTEKTYSAVFKSERQFEGEWLFEVPGRMRKNSREIVHDKKEQKEIQKATSIWIRNQEGMFFKSEEEEMFERSTWMLDRRVIEDPFVAGVKVDELRRGWLLKLLKHDEKRIIISATPRTSVMQRHTGRCLVMIDPKTWQTVALKQFDPSESFWVLTTIEDRQTNVEFAPETFVPQPLKSEHQPTTNTVIDRGP